MQNPEQIVIALERIMEVNEEMIRNVESIGHLIGV